MKKSFLAIMLLAAIFGCSKSNVHSAPELNDNILSVTNQKSTSTMRMSQTMLTGAEKKILWTAKYDAIIKNDKNKLTEKQFEIVIKLKNFLKTYDFDNQSVFKKIGEDFANSNMKEFEKNFTPRQLFVLIELPVFNENFSIFNSEIYLDSLEDDEYGEEAKKCNCYWSISCFPSACHTSGATCTKITACGLWGDSNCTGRCG
jgi:hypothetical protein